MNFMLGFKDELEKLAQKQRPEGYYSPEAVMKRMGPGPMGPPKPQAAGPRPAPGTRMPKPVYREKTWTPKPKQPKATGIPKAEGIVPGTFQRQLPALPSGKKMPRAGGIVSEVGARKRWEAKVKKEESKLPGWLSDSMKRPVKGHPMAKAEDVARSKKEDAEARNLIAGYTKQKPGTAVARRKRPRKPLGNREWLDKRMKQKGTHPWAKWIHGKTKGTFLAPSEGTISRYRRTGQVGPRTKPGFNLGGAVLGAAEKVRRFVSRVAGGKPASVPGYRAVAKKKTI